MKTLERITQNADKLTRSQQAIAAYVWEHMDSIAFSNLETLSQQIGVSTTTVIRFSRAIGFSGFSDMQSAVQNEIQQKSSLPERLDSIGDGSRNQLLKDTFEIDQENIRLTLAAQSDDTVKRAVDLMSQANSVYILGMRSSFSVAYYMASRLGEIKKNVRFIQSTGMLYPEEIVGAEEGDVCLTYLFPRYSKAATNILHWLRSRGVKVILITALNYEAIQSYGDIILPCAIRSASYKNSLTAPICLSNYLAAELARQNYEEAREILSRTESVLSSGYYLGF